MNKGKIYCIGDSNTRLFMGHNIGNAFREIISCSLLPDFKVYHLGPCTAYNLQNEESTSGGRKKLFDRLKGLDKGNRVMLIFGGVDCIFHIEKQARKQNVDIKFIIEDCVIQYIKTILEVKEMGFSVLVWGMIASPSDETMIKNNFPIYTNEVERNKNFEYYNYILERELNKNGVTFVSIFNSLIDGKYKTKGEYYYTDGLHLSQKALPIMLGELQERGIIPRISKFGYFFDYVFVPKVKELLLYPVYIIKYPWSTFPEIYQFSAILKRKFKWYREFLSYVKGNQK